MCYPRVVNLSSRRCTKCAFDLKPGGEQHLGNLNGLGTFDATKPAYTAASSCAAASRSARFPLAGKKLFCHLQRRRHLWRNRSARRRGAERGRDGDDGVRTLGFEPQGFFAGPRNVCGAGWVVPAKYYEQVGQSGFMQKPIGAGPYKLVSQEPGVRLDFEAFESYYRPVHIKQFSMISVPEAATRVAMLERGEADIMYF